jgi:hypothetical protein
MSSEPLEQRSWTFVPGSDQDLSVGPNPIATVGPNQVGIPTLASAGMCRSPSRPLLVGVTILIAVLLCGCSGPSAPTASPRFCQPVKRLMGTDAVDVVKALHGMTSVMPFIGATDQLERDINLSLPHAPTAQLRRELLQYRRSITGVGSSDAVLGAMSHFDRLAGAHVSSCGIRPIHG